MDDPAVALPVYDARHHATYDAVSVVILRGELLRRLVGRDELDAAAIRAAVANLQASVQTLALEVVGLALPARPVAVTEPLLARPKPTGERPVTAATDHAPIRRQ
jgi:hypothetical protein